MSTVEEEYLVVPWVGPTSCKNVFSIVVLGSNAEIIERIAMALADAHAKGDFRWKLRILRSFSLEEIVRQSDLTGRIAIDFVVVGIDSRSVQADKTGFAWIRKAVAEVHPDLRSRRLVIVNTSYQQQSSFSVPAEELLALQNELRLDMLHTNISQKDDVDSLARRLLRYMEVSFGTKTGLPNLNI